jgi:hypothetical protein
MGLDLENKLLTKNLNPGIRKDVFIAPATSE